MSAAQIGGIIGAVLGLANFVWLRGLAQRVEQSGDQGAPEQKSSTDARANIIRFVAIADMIVMPIVGYLIGPVVAVRI